VQISEYELVRQVQGRHWWWLGREKIIETLVEKYIDTSVKLEIADVGCGFGANISMLRQYGDVTGLELNAEALDTVKSRWGDSVNTVNWQSPDPLAARFNFMLLADVLEHIPDDKEAVDWISEHLMDDGYTMITVPAHQFLWTQMDEVLHHHRRYTQETLLTLFDDRFEIVYCSYYNMLLFPVKVCFVMFDRLKQFLFPSAVKRSYNDVPPAFINSIFKQILLLESSFIRRGKLPFGISLVCLARKKASNTQSE
jgi:SAM-dependent methyltransferase